MDGCEKGNFGIRRPTCLSEKGCSQDCAHPPVPEEEVGFATWGKQSYSWASTFFLGK